MQDPQHIDVPIVFRPMVQSADDVHLGAASVGRFPAASENLFVGHHVPFRVAQIGPKRAEYAAVDTDIGRVQVRVDVVVGRVAVLLLADQVGQLPDLAQRRLGIGEEQTVVEREPSAGLDLFADGCE